jgi:hypothetical protein
VPGARVFVRQCFRAMSILSAGSTGWARERKGSLWGTERVRAWCTESASPPDMVERVTRLAGKVGTSLEAFAVSESTAEMEIERDFACVPTRIFC